MRSSSPVYWRLTAKAGRGSHRLHPCRRCQHGRRPRRQLLPAPPRHLQRHDCSEWGLYSSGMLFGSYMDDLVYRNSPCDYMRNFPTTHPYMKLFEKADKFISAAARGAWKLTCWPPRRSCRPFSRARASIPSWTSGVGTLPTTGTGGEKQWVYFPQMTLGDA